MKTRAPLVPEYLHQSFVLLPGTKCPALYAKLDGVLPIRFVCTVMVAELTIDTFAKNSKPIATKARLQKRDNPRAGTTTELNTISVTIYQLLTSTATRC